MTDSSAGITQAEAKDLGVVVVPIPFTMDDQEYLEDVNCTTAEFFKKLQAGATVSTSQPAQIDLENIWTQQLKEYDTIIYLPITSGLSGSCANAKIYAEKFNGRVLVVDNLRISVPLKASVLEALNMVKAGKSATEIYDYLMATKDQFSIYITLSTLKYLRKGGRVTPATALLGDLLNLKPILSTRGQNFDKAAVALSMRQAKKKMMAKIKQELQTEFKEPYAQGKMVLAIAYTEIDESELLQFRAEIGAEFPGMRIIAVNPLCLGIAVHTGAGALGFGTCRYDFSL